MKLNVNNFPLCIVKVKGKMLLSFLFGWFGVFCFVLLLLLALYIKKEA